MRCQLMGQVLPQATPTIPLTLLFRSTKSSYWSYSADVIFKSTFSSKSQL